MEENKSNKTLKVILIIVAILLVIGLVVYFVFFHKNKNVRNAEEAISDIGTVTLDSGDDIEEAQELYDDLTSMEKKKVSNVEDLENAIDEYEVLLNKEVAKEVDELIKSIGEVTADSENAIKKARDAFDDLTSRQKKYVEELDTLEKAEEEFKYLDVKECEELISAIEDAADSPDLKLPLAISAARKAYDALSVSHKERVSNYENLVAAEKAYDEYKEQKDALKIEEEKQSRLDNIKQYCESCEPVTYAKLFNNSDEYEGKNVTIKVDVVSIEEAALFKTEKIIAKYSAGKKSNELSLIDKRSVKEPKLEANMTVTVYGVYNGLDKDGRPEISIKYSSEDSEEAIKQKPTTTEIFNYIEKGVEIAKGLTDILKTIPWKQ